MYGCLSLVFPRPLSVCFLFPTSGIHISSNTMIYYDATSPISFYISRNEINNFTHVHVYLFSPIMQQPGSIVPLVMFYLLQTFSTFASTNIILHTSTTILVWMSVLPTTWQNSSKLIFPSLSWKIKLFSIKKLTSNHRICNVQVNICVPKLYCIFDINKDVENN